MLHVLIRKQVIHHPSDSSRSQIHWTAKTPIEEIKKILVPIAKMEI